MNGEDYDPSSKLNVPPGTSRRAIRDTPGAEEMRSMHLFMLLRLAALKAKRARLEEELGLEVLLSKLHSRNEPRALPFVSLLFAGFGAREMIEFVIRPTVQGWEICRDGINIGIFVTRRQALKTLAVMRAELRADGRRSLVKLESRSRHHAATA